MVAFYVFQSCELGYHESCVGEMDMPTEPEVCGGSVCRCSCHFPKRGTDPFTLAELHELTQDDPTEPTEVIPPARGRIPSEQKDTASLKCKFSFHKFEKDEPGLRHCIRCDRQEYIMDSYLFGCQLWVKL